jgi:hypothetical protein
MTVAMVSSGRPSSNLSNSYRYSACRPDYCERQHGWIPSGNHNPTIGGTTMTKRGILCVFGLLGMGSTFYATGPIYRSPQNIAVGCGVIEGRVVDEMGHPVVGAKVSSMINDRPPRGRLLSTLTDDQGRFELTCAQPGRNMVYVSKEDEYYPDTFLSPFVDAKLIPVVNVAERGVTKGVEVHLPPKGGRLVTKVIDAATQQPVDGARLTLCKADNPNKCYTVNDSSQTGQFSKLVPSMPVTIKVTAPGYEDWWYAENGSREAAKLLVAPGSVKGITILLSPNKRS